MVGEGGGEAVMKSPHCNRVFLMIEIVFNQTQYRRNTTESGLTKEGCTCQGIMLIPAH